MKLEHVAFNVTDPYAAAAWYEKYLGFTVVKKIDAASGTHFIADDSGTVMIEIYNNPPDNVPNYETMDPLQVHLGFVSENPDVDKARLLAAGASYVEELKLPDGTHLIMMKDPWGLAIQLCKRGKPMLRNV